MFFRPINCTLGLSITSQTPYVGIQDKEIRFENITKISARISGLQFLDVPKGDEMRIYNLRLEEEYLLFEAFSSLMEYLQLNKFPTGKVSNMLPTLLSLIFEDLKILLKCLILIRNQHYLN